MEMESLLKWLKAMPVEVTYEMLSYIHRPDWRTCKKKEADIITSYKNNVEECIRGIDHIFEAIKHDNWTLYGHHWVLHADENSFYAHRRPYYPPLLMEDYNKWYTLRIQWLNG